MKNQILVTVSFLLALACQFEVYGQSQDQPYKFPVKPGTPEWQQLKTSSDKISALSLPLDILTNSNTLSLAQTCLNYPLFFEIAAANNIQQGFIALKSNFNGFRELLTRKDAASTLIKVYKALNVKDINLELDHVQKGNFTFKFTYLELLLAQDEIIKQLTQAERQALRSEAMSKFDEKKVLINLYGEFGLNTSALILSKILIADGKQELLLNTITQKEFDVFVNTAQFYSPSLLTVIYDASQSY